MSEGQNDRTSSDAHVNTNPLLNSLVRQDPFLALAPASTTPASSPDGSGRTQTSASRSRQVTAVSAQEDSRRQNSDSRSQQVVASSAQGNSGGQASQGQSQQLPAPGAQDAIYPSLFGQVRPFVAPDRILTVGMKRPPVTEPGDDDAMQGKDVPTIFKRARRRSRDDPFQLPAASGAASFVPIPPAVFIISNPESYANIGSLATPKQLSGVPALPSGDASDMGGGLINRSGASSSSVATHDHHSGPQAGGSGGSRAVVDAASWGQAGVDATDVRSADDEGRNGVDGDDDDDDDVPNAHGEDGDEENDPRPHKQSKGKERMRDSESPGRRASGSQTQFSTFAKKSEVSSIRNDLHEMNHNISRLVTLMDQQTQFFSTLHARGFFQERSAPGGGSSGPPGPPPPPSADPEPMDVDAPDFVPIPRRPRRGRKQAAQPKGLLTQRDPEDVQLADHIRAVTRELMNRKNAKAAIEEDMLPKEEEVDQYDPYDGPCCTIHRFLPDLNSPPSSVWNQSVVEVFVDHFVELYPQADRRRVEELFSGHLKYLCTKWQSSTLGPQTLRKRQKLRNRSERQRNLYYRRLSVAHAYAPLRRHIPMLMALGVKGMSSDESDHQNGYAQYGVFIKDWRAKVITPWLRVFDSLYRRLRMNDGTANSPGSQPHSRCYSDKVSTRRPAVKGLPKNAYSAGWLNKLHAYDRKALLVQDVVYSFKHDRDMVELAKDFNGKHNPLGIYF